MSRKATYTLRRTPHPKRSPPLPRGCSLLARAGPAVHEAEHDEAQPRRDGAPAWSNAADSAPWPRPHVGSTASRWQMSDCSSPRGWVKQPEAFGLG